MNRTTKLDRLFTWFSATYPDWEFQLQYKPNGVKLRVWKNTTTGRVENFKILDTHNPDIEVSIKDIITSMILEVS